MGVVIVLGIPSDVSRGFTFEVADYSVDQFGIPLAGQISNVVPPAVQDMVILA